MTHLGGRGSREEYKSAGKEGEPGVLWELIFVKREEKKERQDGHRQLRKSGKECEGEGKQRGQRDRQD